MDERARVVVGVDGSASARTALEFALQEAARRDAVLDVVSVAVMPEYWPVGIGMASSGVAAPDLEQVVDAVQREAEQLVTDVVGERGATAARVARILGPPTDLIGGPRTATVAHDPFGAVTQRWSPGAAGLAVRWDRSRHAAAGTPAGPA